MQMGQKRQASCQSAYNVGKRAYKARLPGIYRSAVANRAYRLITVARLQSAPTGDLRARLQTAPTRCIETREVSPTGDLWWRGFKARLQTNAAARMLLQILTIWRSSTTETLTLR